MAALTADSTALTDDKGTVVNPHERPAGEKHDENPATCTDCHNNHSKDLPKDAMKYCAQCHHPGAPSSAAPATSCASASHGSARAPACASFDLRTDAPLQAARCLSATKHFRAGRHSPSRCPGFSRPDRFQPAVGPFSLS